MAFKAGYSAALYLDNAAGALQNIQGYIDNISMDQPQDTQDVSVFGTIAKTFVIGLSDGGKLTISGPHDPTLATHCFGLKAAQQAGTASHSFIYGPGGSIASQTRIAGECLYENYAPSSAVGGRIEYTASFQVTGAVTNGTF
jgi:hypothetical protein